MPTAAGAVSSRHRRNPQSNSAENSRLSPVAACLDSPGSRIVPSATPSTPVGSSISRSAKYIHDTLPLCKYDAIFVLITNDTCATDVPKMAGAICLITRFTAGSPKRSFGIFKKPSLNSQGSWKLSCSTPPQNTPQPKAITGCSKCFAPSSAKPMSDTFNNTGVKAGTENLP